MAHDTVDVTGMHMCMMNGRITFICIDYIYANVRMAGMQHWIHGC